MKRLRSLIWSLVFIIGLITTAYGASIKIGYVDVQRVLTESKRGQEAKKKIEAKGAELHQQFQRMQREIQSLKDELERKGTLLSEEARKEKEREYQRKVMELDRFVRDSREELRQMEREMTAKILKDVERVIEELGRKEGYTLILEKQRSFILYAPKELDLTEKVIKALDAEK